MTQQTKRYLSLVFFFAAAGWLVWLGDDWVFLGSVPARHVGYCFAAIAVAGLLGLNIWLGGPLDKRKDAEIEARAKAPTQR